MGLFGNKSNTLEIPGIGAGVNQEQMNMFANAAQQSGLQDYGMQMLNQYTGGGLDTEQIELIHHMVARHPNEMDIFLMQSPHFLLGLSELISLIIRKELYAWFNSPVIPSTVNAEQAATLGYSTITQENIDATCSRCCISLTGGGVISCCSFTSKSSIGSSVVAGFVPAPSVGTGNALKGLGSPSTLVLLVDRPLSFCRDLVA